ncbi:poliovirus receptor isoform X2 [Betta splendens]|uniref:Nectin cell adhesion molecule 3 n=1 Tax=Betta splendens TaxID=158456 RepID=A0A9W2XBJ4_BETSP|nr:poliovirus receptor isoform X2 [Betta splendens]
MARRDGRNWRDCRKMIGLLCLLASILRGGESTQRVKVEPEVSSYPGQTVNLRCAFTDSTGIQLTMVTWIYEPKDGERINIAVFHPSFDPNYPDSPLKGRVSFTPSPPNLNSPSIQINDVMMSDEGKYICEYATYPSGNEQGITYLVMLAKPQNAASVVTVVEGSTPVVVARCEAANGRPAAQISWETTAQGNATLGSKPGVNNTVNVTSEYRMVPTPDDDGREIACVVTHRTQSRAERFPMQLVVQYAPRVSIVGYDNNWYRGRTNALLVCQAGGNPEPVSVQWRTLSGDVPDTVQISGKELKVLKVDDNVNTTFVCEAKNSIGVRREQVTAMVRDTPLPQKVPTEAIVGAIIGVIIVLAVVGIIIALYRKFVTNSGPPRHKPPPPSRTNNSTTRLNEVHVSGYEGELLQSENYIPQGPEPVTDLDGLDDYSEEKKEQQHYVSAAPTGWDDPEGCEADDELGDEVPYMEQTGGEHQGAGVQRGDSFVSPAVFV